MPRSNRIRAATADRPDLRAIEGIMAGALLSTMMWIMMLVWLR